MLDGSSINAVNSTGSSKAGHAEGVEAVGSSEEEFVVVEEGIESALSRRKQQKRRSKIIDGEKEAYLIAIACSETPTGKSHWTLKMLADKMVELNYVEQVSTETIRQTLKKMNL